MSDVIWFKDPAVLFKKTRVLDFWPSKKQSPADRTNATARFMVYAACILYLLNRDVRLLILAMMSFAVMYVLYLGNVIKDDETYPVYSHDENFSPDCQLPTEDNPLGNLLLMDEPGRSPACDYSTVRGRVRSLVDDTIPYDNFRSKAALPSIQQYAAARQFVTMPVSSFSGEEQTDFAEACFGRKFSPMCRSDPSMCSPDARGVQLEAFGGRGMLHKGSGSGRQGT